MAQSHCQRDTGSAARLILAECERIGFPAFQILIPSAQSPRNVPQVRHPRWQSHEGELAPLNQLHQVIP